MRFDKVISLVAVVDDVNSNDDPIKKHIPRETFAKEKSVRQSEFYQAAATGFKPEIVFIVWTTEYHGEEMLEYRDTMYNIIRTFEIDNKLTEIICSGLVNGVK